MCVSHCKYMKGVNLLRKAEVCITEKIIWTIQPKMDFQSFTLDMHIDTVCMEGNFFV